MVNSLPSSLWAAIRAITPVPHPTSRKVLSCPLWRRMLPAARHRSPPDSSEGLWPVLSESPTSCSSRSASSRAVFSLFPPISEGIITFSSAVNSGSRCEAWKTKPIRRLRKEHRASPFITLQEGENTLWPSMTRVPLSGVESVPRICSRVLFPAPEPQLWKLFRAD